MILNKSYIKCIKIFFNFMILNISREMLKLKYYYKKKKIFFLNKLNKIETFFLR